MISVITPSIRPKGLEVTQRCLQNQSFKDFEWLVELGLPPVHDLNAAFNRMLRRAKGELIVFLEDHIEIPNDGLEQFWRAYQNHGKVFFTAPVGKRDHNINSSFINWDWRVHAQAQMDWRMWEIDWGAAPLSALQELGGFDEQLDAFWSFDNVNVGCRADLAGYTFKCLRENKAIALDHDLLEPHPFRDRYNPDFHNERLDYFRMGGKIDYLTPPT